MLEAFSAVCRLPGSTESKEWLLCAHLQPDSHGQHGQVMGGAPSRLGVQLRNCDRQWREFTSERSRGITELRMDKKKVGNSHLNRQGWGQEEAFGS